MKNFGASIAGFLICLLAGTVAWAQSDSARKSPGTSDVLEQNSKPSDKGNTKPGQTTKKHGKDTKPKPPKSTGKKTEDSVGVPEGDSGDAPGTPDGSNNADGGGAANGKAAVPNWSVDKIRLAPHATNKYVRDAVTLEPTEGRVLIEARFQIEAIRSDAKAVERYSRVLTSVDRKTLTRNAKTGARVLESKNIALRDPDGKRYGALWSLQEEIRTNIAHFDIAPNNQSSRHTSSGSVSPTGPWLDAEQSFITRISRPFNQPPVTEYATVFTGILRTDRAFPVTFLFSVPASLDLQSLKLVVDYETFVIDE